MFVVVFVIVVVPSVVPSVVVPSCSFAMFLYFFIRDNPGSLCKPERNTYDSKDILPRR